MIRTTGFFRNKSKSIRAACAQLVEAHGREVPGTMEKLVGLPGVGRKTANVLLGTCFGKPGIIVDTHLSRVTRRLGLAKAKDPDKIEAELVEIVARKDRTTFSHVIGFHGRQVCVARKPQCEVCHISRWCDYYAQRA